ncbi:uncharacterized protein LOC143430312 [Xylocopa sonorina]|uniref:uncharacterized protein LOC143430312 n=1 Tax=Xylocopa sonorina TaxID=1818115 RepID=UPI00403AB7AD
MAANRVRASRVVPRLLRSWGRPWCMHAHVGAPVCGVHARQSWEKRRTAGPPGVQACTHAGAPSCSLGRSPVLSLVACCQRHTVTRHSPAEAYATSYRRMENAFANRCKRKCGRFVVDVYSRAASRAFRVPREGGRRRVQSG